jgi:hypothetical protein
MRSSRHNVVFLLGPSFSTLLVLNSKITLADLSEGQKGRVELAALLCLNNIFR